MLTHLVGIHGVLFFTLVIPRLTCSAVVLTENPCLVGRICLPLHFDSRNFGSTF